MIRLNDALNAALSGLLFALGIVISSYAAGEDQLTYLPSPSPDNSSLSRVVASESGEIYLSWVSQNADQATLAFARLTGEGWDTAQVISEGRNWFVNWADFPALSVDSSGMVAHWLQMSAMGTYDYARSNWALSFTSRHAAPKHTRETPACLARLAISTTLSFSIRRSGLTPVE